MSEKEGARELEAWIESKLQNLIKFEANSASEIQSYAAAYAAFWLNRTLTELRRISAMPEAQR